jgi:hypothetical protein
MYNFQNVKFHKNRLVWKGGCGYNVGSRAVSAMLLCKEAEKCKNGIKFKFQ